MTHTLKEPCGIHEIKGCLACGNLDITLKDIFERISDKDWDWFGYKGVIEIKPVIKPQAVYIDVPPRDSEFIGDIKFSLADLLANKSFLVALFGADYCYKSRLAYTILRDKGQQQALDYIAQTLN